MDLGEFRKHTKDLPDNTDILVHLGDLEMHEANEDMTLPPVLEHPHAFVLVLGQVWNYELDIDARIDARHL